MKKAAFGRWHGFRNKATLDGKTIYIPGTYTTTGNCSRFDCDVYILAPGMGAAVTYRGIIVDSAGLPYDT